MPGAYNRFVKRAPDSLQRLSSPQMQNEAAQQDMYPPNVQELQRALQDPRHQGPMQQQVLGDELKRIKGMQTLQLKQAAQQMPQQLEMSLSPAKTGEPWPSPEATVIRLMLQMRRRHGVEGDMQ